MITYSVEIKDPADHQIFLSVLEAFRKKNILQFKVVKPKGKENIPLSLPGEPVSDEELLNAVEKAEASPLVSYEDAKKHFDV